MSVRRPDKKPEYIYDEYAAETANNQPEQRFISSTPYGFSELENGKCVDM
jgi:hypothetical protein